MKMGELTETRSASAKREFILLIPNAKVEESAFLTNLKLFKGYTLYKTFTSFIVSVLLASPALTVALIKPAE